MKFRDLSGQNIARLKLEVEHNVNNNAQIKQNVSSNTNNFCNNIFVIYSNCYPPHLTCSNNITVVKW